VGTNVGLASIDPESEVCFVFTFHINQYTFKLILSLFRQIFKFSGLLGFQLTSKGRHPTFYGECEELPQQMWDMLVKRSPDLREIIIGHRDAIPCSDRTFNVLPITEARETWLNLHTMVLSNGVLFPMFELNRDEERAAEKSFSTLIAAHPTLRKMNLMRFRHLVFPACSEETGILKYQWQFPHISPLDFYFEECALSTNYAFVRFYPSWNIVYEIDLCNVAIKPWMFRVLRSILQKHKALRSFGVWADLTRPAKDSRLHVLAEKNDYDFMPVLKSFIDASENLEHIKFRCTSDGKLKNANWASHLSG
jgi:hypothetical protein